MLHGPHGDNHVHAAGCRDIARYGPFADPFTIDLDLGDDAAYAVARFIYEDHVGDHGYEYDSPEAVEYWKDVALGIKVFPCVRKDVS